MNTWFALSLSQAKAAMILMPGLWRTGEREASSCEKYFGSKSLYFLLLRYTRWMNFVHIVYYHMCSEEAFSAVLCVKYAIAYLLIWSMRKAQRNSIVGATQPRGNAPFKLTARLWIHAKLNTSFLHTNSDGGDEYHISGHHLTIGPEMSGRFGVV